MDYETGKINLIKLGSDYSASNRNEASTRFHLIDRLFCECLGWEREDCSLEESYAGEFTDYTFKISSRRVLVVEAKKEGDYFEVSVEKIRKKEYLISTLCKDNPNLKKAINQTISYCQARGVPVGCVCNGPQIVIFIACRTDGISPLEGRAVVFVSFDHMIDNSLKLWNFMSKEGIKDERIIFHLLEKPLPVVPNKLSSRLLNYPGLKNRNSFQIDLQMLSDIVLEDMPNTKSMEKEFLSYCYCPSGALSQHAMISKSLLRARHTALFSSDIKAPKIEQISGKKGIADNFIAESISKRPILLIGSVGSGKTMFTRHLINIEASEIFEKAITLHLDLGETAILGRDIKGSIVDIIIKQLIEIYNIDIFEDTNIRKIYPDEIKRFDKSIYGKLKKTNDLTFVKKEIEMLEKLTSQTEKHLKNSLTFYSNVNRKQVIIFLDNIDQRSEDDQQSAFLVAQELAANWKCTVYLALRPETFHRSVKSGALDAYHPKAFSIAPPRIDDVIEKRLNFALQILRKKLISRDETLNTLFDVNYSKMEIIIKSFKTTLLRKKDTVEAIDNISGGNVRKALGFVKTFFCSGHVDTEKIVAKGEGYSVPLHEFLRAIIFGDSIYYNPESSPIANLFDATRNDPKEHFLIPVLLSILNSLTSSNSEDGFINMSKVIESSQGIGLTPTQINETINRCIKYSLLKSSGSSDKNEEEPIAVRITTVGEYHRKKLLLLFVYYDAIIVDTPILDHSFKSQIKDEQTILGRLNRCDIFCDYLDLMWEQSNLPTDVFDWKIYSNAIRNNIYTIRRELSSHRAQKND
ncbi:MAG: ATP-binding protein [Nitrospinota bacterium]|nr:ATP-binding protein [Nitrospinota bacterium]